jgi:hypothetical protein
MGLLIGVAFAYFGVLLPKVAAALDALGGVRHQIPPDHDS